MKYYEFSNRKHYRLARERKLSSRDEPYGGPSFEDRYCDHEVHELVEKTAISKGSRVLVIGTGTGADACWLAEHGHTVTGIDIVQDAIDIAREIAADRETNITFFQDDICNIKNNYGAFDVIVDSFCLQSIVLDDDRSRVFSFVQTHLGRGGHYFVISAGYSPRKEYHEDYFRDEQTAIVYQRAKGDETDLADIIVVKGKSYVPVRRHHTIVSLTGELRRHGFWIVYSSTNDEWGDLKAVVTI
jgi:predicted RNA methylase